MPSVEASRGYIQNISQENHTIKFEKPWCKMSKYHNRL